MESGTFATPLRGSVSLKSPVLPAMDVGVCRLAGEDCHDPLGLGEDRGPRRFGYLVLLVGNLFRRTLAFPLLDCAATTQCTHAPKAVPSEPVK